MRRAENLNVAVGYVAEIKQAFEQRRLAGAVHANQAEKLAGGHVKRDAAQSLRTAEILDHSGKAQCGFGHGQFTSPIGMAYLITFAAAAAVACRVLPFSPH
jgi:hypothetical protein